MSVQTIPIASIDDSYSSYRLITPAQVSAMQQSLDSSGQLHPVIVCLRDTAYLLIDGFKRFHAVRALGWETINVQVLEADQVTAKVMILVYNSHAGSLVNYEQACIVHSLSRDHLLSQEEIARLVHRSISWVSRRLSFIERLDETVKTHLRLGKITSTHARELSLLPRGKQSELLKIVVGHTLTSRQTGLLVKKYLYAPAEEQEQMLLRPMETIKRATVKDRHYDNRLSAPCNALLKTARLLINTQCLFIEQSAHLSPDTLSSKEKEVISCSFTEIMVNAKIIVSTLPIKN
jgi:ParB family chromosome partitioning protein